MTLYAVLQIVTEMILGFDKNFATPQLLARQDALFHTLHQGLFALPINLPGTGDSCHIAAELCAHLTKYLCSNPKCILRRLCICDVPLITPAFILCLHCTVAV